MTRSTSVKAWSSKRRPAATEAGTLTHRSASFLASTLPFFPPTDLQSAALAFMYSALGSWSIRTVPLRSAIVMLAEPDAKISPDIAKAAPFCFAVVTT